VPKDHDIGKLLEWDVLQADCPSQHEINNVGTVMGNH